MITDNRVVNLPLGVPIIDVHSFHAFSQAIILTRKDKSLPWIVTNYIHIFGVPHFDKGNFIHLATSSHFHSLPYTYVSKLHTDQLRSWFTDSIELFVDCLNKQQYLAIALDEFYIPGMHAYLKYHLVHHVLVHGYDWEQRLFRIAGFFGDPPVFTTNRTLSFELFQEALAHAGPVTQRASQTLEIIQFPYQALNTPIFEFDIKLIIRSLEEHLLSKPVTERNPKRIDFWFGLSAYDLLIQFLELERDSGKPIIHMKALQTLVNHKKLMIERMKYLFANYYMTDDRFIAMAEQVLRKTMIVHQLCVKQRIVQDPRNIARAIHGIEELKAYEKDFLEQLLDHLENAN
ncbi:hypothetical protein [Paenibacillus sp. FSL H8-0034]|uniref:hypothetical protein n=1 Tax=Paenibacillus sp. FSL H8-0034 TaxID=2954671 RepID=UPI0030F54C65